MQNENNKAHDRNAANCPIAYFTTCKSPRKLFIYFMDLIKILMMEYNDKTRNVLGNQ